MESSGNAGKSPFTVPMTGPANVAASQRTSDTFTPVAVSWSTS